MEKASKAELKNIREFLRKRKSRDKEGLFVAEGMKIVRDILEKGHLAESIYISGSVIAAPSVRRLLGDAEKRKVRIRRIPGPEFDKISTLHNSQGVLALVKKPVVLKQIRGDRLVLCDGIQDPGNLGTMIRSSVAFGADGILLSGNTADVYSPKVVRASSGMMLDIPLRQCDTSDILDLKDNGYRVYVSTSSDARAEDITGLKMIGGRAIIAFGNEGSGVSKDILGMADDRFCIPIDKKAESLNVTAAAAISLYVLFGRGKREER